MDSFEGMMTRVLVNGIKICYQKCAPKADRDYLNNFEKNCVGKCVDKHHESYMLASNKLIAVFSDFESEKDF